MKVVEILPRRRARLYAALVANAAASAADAWEVAELVRLRPPRAREVGGRVECVWPD